MFNKEWGTIEKSSAWKLQDWLVQHGEWIIDSRRGSQSGYYESRSGVMKLNKDCFSIFGVVLHCPVSLGARRPHGCWGCRAPLTIWLLLCGGSSSGGHRARSGSWGGGAQPCFLELLALGEARCHVMRTAKQPHGQPQEERKQLLYQLASHVMNHLRNGISSPNWAFRWMQHQLATRWTVSS